MFGSLDIRFRNSSPVTMTLEIAGLLCHNIPDHANVPSKNTSFIIIIIIIIIKRISRAPI